MLEVAERIIAALPGGVPRPHISRSEDGEVGMSWTKGNDRLEAMLDPDDGGHLTWISKVDGDWLLGGDIPSSGNMETFHAALTDFFEASIGES